MIVLDTNVVSELMRSAPDPAVVTWVRAQPPWRLCTTAITVAEVFYGIQRLPRGRRRTSLATAATDVFGAFASDILAFDAQAGEQYAQIVAARDRAGSPITVLDAQIAAICVQTNSSLATRNTADFDGIGLALVDPWATVEP